jgi:hypothetical protein
VIHNKLDSHNNSYNKMPNFQNVIYRLGIVILFIGVAYLLSMRSLYVAPDDISYIKYFNGDYFYSVSTNWWIQLLEEPLWGKYTLIVGNNINSETAVRITIFISSLGFLFFASKVGNNKSIYILLVFLLSLQLSTQLYFNQIRQGVALSVFFFGLMFGFNRSLFFAVIASMIHTSFIVVVFAQIIVILTRDIKHWLLVLTLLAVFISVFIYVSDINFIDYTYLLGRREFAYGFLGKLNYKFYLIFGPLYIYAILFMKKYMKSDNDILFWKFVLLFTIIIFIFSFLYEGITRLFYFNYIFIPLLFTKGFQYRLPKRASLIWLLIIVFFNSYDHLVKGLPKVQTWFGRWDLIIFG